MNILKWFKPKNASLAQPEWWSQFLSSSATSGVAVTPSSALEVGAVYACVRILAETVSSLPLKVYREVDGERRVVDNHPISRVLGSISNPDMTAMEVREQIMLSLCLWGNAYLYIDRNSRGQVRGLWPLDPAHMVMSRGENGRLSYFWAKGAVAKTFNHMEIWRIAAIGKDGIKGLSPINLARESVGIAISSERSAAQLFSNGTQAPLALEYPSVMNEEQVGRLRKQWADQHSGTSNAHKPIILEGGMTAKTIGMKPDDAQFLESRKWQIAEIARWFRVPLHMLNELDRATFSNIEHQSIEFVQHTIRPWLVRIEQTIARDLLNNFERDSGYFVAHSVEGLLRGDTASRYDAYGKAIKDGWMNRNEVRRLENLNPADGLDEYLTPMNMQSSIEEEEAPEETPDEGPQNQINALAEAENRALAKELTRGPTPEGFATWAVDYYQRQESRLTEKLGVDASGYAKTRLLRMADAKEPIDAVTEATKHTLNDMKGITHE